MGWFKKMTGISTPSVLKKVDDKIVQPTLNAAHDVAKVAFSTAVAIPVASVALVSGESMSQAIADLPGSKDEAEKVGIAALAVAGSVAATTYFGASAGIGAGTAEVATTDIVLSGVASGEVFATTLPPLAMDAATAATVTASTGATVATFGESISAGIGAIKTTTGAVSTIAGAAKAIQGAANAAQQTATDYSRTINNSDQKQNDIFLVASVAMAAAFFL